jgi:hypothetical protein
MSGCLPDATAATLPRDWTRMSRSECTFVLTIEPGSDPIAGKVRDPAGSAVPFVGYAELAAQLERYRQLDAATPEEPGD